jgi:Uma2 family endonuclease
MTPSPFFGHQACSAKLVSSLLAAVERTNCNAAVAQEVDWIISNDTVVRPDILLVCGDPPEYHVTRPPALIVEILSESTAGRDRNQKRKLYEDNGVDYYLIVDPNDRTIEAYQRNEKGEYEAFEPDSLGSEVPHLTPLGGNAQGWADGSLRLNLIVPLFA